MARGTTADERRASVTIIPDGEEVPLDDIESAFENWRDSFETADEPGKIRAYQVPLDERGVVNLTAKAQPRLGAWAIDLYDFDDLCGMIVREFMIPNKEKIMAVRFIGTKAGVRGVAFNKVVVLRAPEHPTDGSAQPNNRESMSELLNAFQATNRQTLEMFQRMQPQPPPQVDRLADMKETALFLQQMQAPMMTLLGALLQGRGTGAAPGGDPFASLSGALSVVEKLKDLTTPEGGGGDEGGSDLVQAIRAIAPIAKPAMELATQAIAAQRMAPRRPRIDARATPTGAPGALPPGAQPTAAPPPPPQENLTDIPSGDTAMFAQLKPQIDALVSMAQQGGDPEGAADLLFDNVLREAPDDVYNKVTDIIEGENFIKHATVFNPAVAQHKEFFDKFRTQLVKRVKEEDAAAGSEPSA